MIHTIMSLGLVATAMSLVALVIGSLIFFLAIPGNLGSIQEPWVKLTKNLYFPHFAFPLLASEIAVAWIVLMAFAVDDGFVLGHGYLLVVGVDALLVITYLYFVKAVVARRRAAAELYPS